MRPAHPAALLFPMMTPTELQDLADDIKAHGQIHPIVRLNGQILDGRNRLRACEMAGVEPTFTDWTPNGSSPSEWVIAANLIRRHLTASQRAGIAADARILFAEEAQKAILAGRRDPADNCQQGPRAHDTAVRAAELVGVSARQVLRASEVKRKAPEVFEQIKAGEKTVHAALTELHAAPASDPPPQTKRQREIQAAAVKRMHSLFAGLEGYRRGMEDKDMKNAINGADADELAHWERVANQFLSRLRELRKALQEAQNHATD